MQFQVPQFIEVEDKIFGPLTLKQFIYLAGGGGVILMLYILVKPFFIAILLMIPILMFTLALAFYKINNKPFLNVVESASKYFFNPKLYIWHKESKPMEVAATGEKENTEENTSFMPKLGNSKLKDLTWSLGTKGDMQTPQSRSNLK